MNLTAKTIWFTVGAVTGLILVMFAAPVPAAKKQCDLYKVSKHVATSYVLKPPPSPLPDPVIIKEKCSAPVAATEDSVSAPEATNDDSRPRRHHRSHWRHRRHWR